MRTVDEKYAFNEKRKTEFGNGYCIGVTAYRNYGNCSAKDKAEQKRVFNDFARLARSGDEFGKGVMCALRDCANERKSR